MSTRERPLDLISGGNNLRMGELARMATAIERVTTMQGSHLIQGSNGMRGDEKKRRKVLAYYRLSTPTCRLLSPAMVVRVSLPAI